MSYSLTNFFFLCSQHKRLPVVHAIAFVVLANIQITTTVPLLLLLLLLLLTCELITKCKLKWVASEKIQLFNFWVALCLLCKILGVHKYLFQLGTHLLNLMSHIWGSSIRFNQRFWYIAILSLRSFQFKRNVLFRIKLN